MSAMAHVGGSPAAPATSAITPLVLTYNEAANITRCLERLTWAPRVVVLDSGSTDETIALVGRFPNAEIHTRAFDNHTTQWNYGMDLVRTPWVLALDADYVLSDGWGRVLENLTLADDLDAMYASFRYCIFGRPLRASLYPPRAVLFRRERCRYEPDGHTQRLVVRGKSASLPAAIDHDDRKSLDRWFASQNAYSRLEADKLLSRPPGQLSRQDRLRRGMIFGPIAVFVYTLIVKRTILDGWPGWYYTLQRTIAEMMLSLHILDRRLRG